MGQNSINTKYGIKSNASKSDKKNEVKSQETKYDQTMQINDALKKIQVEQTIHSNTGNMGLVILNPADKRGARNSESEIENIEIILKDQNPDISEDTKNKLITALKEGKLAFGHNKLTSEGIINNYEELWSLTEKDAKLLLKYADEASNISDNEALLEKEVNLRKEYFNDHRLIVPEKYIKNKNQVLANKASEKPYTGNNLLSTTDEEKNLVEGAKIFVDTYVEKLDENEYIAARWNGKTRTKPSDPKKVRQTNLYYDNMVQVHIDRCRIANINGEDVKHQPAKQSDPEHYGYIGGVTYLANKYLFTHL